MLGRRTRAFPAAALAVAMGLSACAGSDSSDGAGSGADVRDAAKSRTNYLASGDSVLALEQFWVGEQEPEVAGIPQRGRIRLVGADEVPGSGAARPAGGAIRFELRPFEPAGGAPGGDVTTTGSQQANRAEVWGRSPLSQASTPTPDWPDPPGSTRWFSFPLYVPEDFQFAEDDKWLTLTQWKGYRGGSPPVALELRRKDLYLKTESGGSRLGRLVPGEWTHLTIGIRFSLSEQQGWVEVVRDGRTVLPRRSAVTAQEVRGEVTPSYLKQGIYRTTRWQTTHVAWFGDTVVGEEPPPGLPSTEPSEEPSEEPSGQPSGQP